MKRLRKQMKKLCGVNFLVLHNPKAYTHFFSFQLLVCKPNSC